MNKTNNFALISADVGEALKRSASSLASADVDLSESVAMIISAQESTQDASKVGNALKSLSVNLKGIKTNAKSGSIELNKTAMALKKYAGIDVTKSNGDIMDTFEILTELSKKWDTFNKQTKAGISESIAGKYQYNVFNAMMDNWEQALSFQQQYKDGWMVGSAEKEKQYSPYVQKCA